MQDVQTNESGLPMGGDGLNQSGAPEVPADAAPVSSDDTALPTTAAEEEATPGEAAAPEASAESTPEEKTAVEAEEPVATVGTGKFYNGAEVLERLGNVDASGAEECKLADGTTAFVPADVLN